MAQSVRLSDKLVKQAKTVGEVMSRSGAGQIEHWARIGKIAEENPDLSYEFIRDSLLAKAEIENGLVDDYEFNHQTI
ncbi:ParD-like family protein [Legionella fairfieldensis]|uniref:ParD-like family protein n=1 Tax=Legionella fairfieldensis TaxID=45064 RepID=UPI0004904A22|nr:ParD-like family protein [Legionella fairfieldensis]